LKKENPLRQGVMKPNRKLKEEKIPNLHAKEKEKKVYYRRVPGGKIIAEK